MDKLRAIIKSSPFVIALIYIIVGVIWIQYSDQMVLSLFDDSATITQVQSLKGWFYVLTSGILIFFLVYQSNVLINGLVKDVKKSRDKFEATFEHAPLGIAHHKPNEKWLLVNRSLSQLLGYTRKELLQLNFDDFIHPDDLEGGRKMDRDLTNGEISSYKTEKKYKRKNGSYFTGRVTKAAVFDKEQKPLYLIAILEDITQQKENEIKLKQSLAEKEVLLSEVHHRVKNNIALMAALLELHLMHIKGEEITEILEHYKTRLKTLSLIYENFSGEEDEPVIDFSWYLYEQIEYLEHVFKEKSLTFKYKKDIQNITLNINQAIPVGLICNELLINAIYHEFEDVGAPAIEVSLQQKDERVLFTVQNNGILKNDKFNLNDPTSLDSRILAALVKQVEGEVSLQREENFKNYTLSFAKGKWRGAASYSHPEL